MANLHVYDSNADVLAAAAPGLVGDYFDQVSYYGIANSTSSGSNRFILRQAASPGARPPDDGGSIIHVAAPNDTLYLEGLFPGGLIYAEQFGARGDGSTGNHTAITNALAFADSSLRFGEGDFVVEDEIEVNKEGFAVIGAGSGNPFASTIGNGTRLLGSKALDAVIRVTKESCSLIGFSVDVLAESARAQDHVPPPGRNVTSANYNCGIRLEGADSQFEGVRRAQVIDVQVVNQPCDGIALFSRCYRSRFVSVSCIGNDGHGYVISDGRYIGRQNTQNIPGIVDFDSCFSKSNNGHGWLIGDLTDDYAFRITIKNSEGLRNCGTTSILIDPANPVDSFIHCDGFTLLNGAFKGTNKEGTAKANSGVALAGQGGVLLDPRILDTDEPVRLVTTTRASYGWYLVNPHVREGATSSYVAFVAPGVENVYVWDGDKDALNPTSRPDVANLDTTSANGERLLNQTIAATGTITDANGLTLTSIAKVDNLTVDTTAQDIFDAAEPGKKWRIDGRHIGTPCTAAFTAEVTGGTTPVVTNTVNQTGAAVDYVLTVSSTMIQLATAAGTRTTDLTVWEVVSSD
ncbi:MAG: hypothetical protein Kilf2KO_34990 [Rhodospirillales bacterium]